MGLLRRSDSDGYCPKGRIQLPTSDEAEIHFQRQAFFLAVLLLQWVYCPKGRIQLQTSDEAANHFQRQAFSRLSCCF